MTCHCHDPCVFGHITCGETQPWTQPPLTYQAGETFTINGTTISAGETIMRACDAGHIIRQHTARLTELTRTFRSLHEYVQNTPYPPRNPPEPGRTKPNPPAPHRTMGN